MITCVAFLFHVVLGMTIFCCSLQPLVPCGVVCCVGYLFRPYQVVRSRRLNLPPGHNEPPRPGAGA